MDRTDILAREFRDAAMESKTTDVNWESCRVHWMPQFHKFEKALAERGLQISEIPKPSKIKPLITPS